MNKFKTRVDISEEVREQVQELAQQHLTNSIDLQLQVKQAHWNVKGASFIALHELFDKIAEETEDYVDTLAERIVQLGGTAAGTLQAVNKSTQLTPYPLRAVTGEDHLNAVAVALSTFGKGVRRAIDEADKLGDKDSADIFTEISRGIDKNLWIVEAHLQAE